MNEKYTNDYEIEYSKILYGDSFGWTAVQKTRKQSVDSILDNINIVEIEQYLRRKKLENINKKV